MEFGNTPGKSRLNKLFRIKNFWGEKMSKQFFKCKVCLDIHYGESGPELCPTCDTKDAYEESTKEEAKERMGL